MAESLWKWIGAVLAVVLVLQLTAPSTASPMNRHDNRNDNNNHYHRRSAINEVTQTTANQARRVPRYAKPNGIFEFFGALNSIKGIVGDQYNDTLLTLQKVMAVASDQFSDTPKKPKPTISPAQNTTEAGAEPTTEKYRISRQELGYLLGKNYRGLRKLFNIELQDAQNQSRITIREYKRDFGRILSPYTIPTKLPEKKKDS